MPVKALYAWSEDAWAVSEGEILLLTEDGDEWLGVRSLSSLRGQIPTTYVERMQVKSRINALYDYQPQTDVELEIREGQLLDLYEEIDENWVLVGDGGREGLVPSTYISQNGNNQEIQEIEGPIEKKPADQKEKLLNALQALGPAPKYKPVSPRASTIQEPLPEESPTINQGSIHTPTPTTTNFHEKAPQNIKYFAVTHIPKKKKNSKNGLLGISDDCVYFADTDMNLIEKYEISAIEKVTEKKKKVILEIKSGNAEFECADKISLLAIITKINEGKVRSKISKPILSNPVPVVGMKEEEHAPVEQNIQSYQNTPYHEEQNYSNSYHHETQQEANPSPHVLQETIPSFQQSNRTLRALYDYSPQNADELALYESEHLTVVDDGDNEWMLVRNDRGEQGYVPKNYVDELTQEQEQSAFNYQEQSTHVEQEIPPPPAPPVLPLPITNDIPKPPPLKPRPVNEEIPRPAPKTVDFTFELQNKLAKKDSNPPPPPQPPEPERKPSLPRRPSDKTEQKPTLPTRPPEAVAKPSLPARPHTSSSAASTPSNTTPSTSTPTSTSEKPDPTKLRTWKDASGAFSIRAQYIGLKNGKVTLWKENGVKIGVDVDKLGKEDKEFLGLSTSDENYGKESKQVEKEEKETKTPPIIHAAVRKWSEEKVNTNTQPSKENVKSKRESSIGSNVTIPPLAPPPPSSTQTIKEEKDFEKYSYNGFNWYTYLLSLSISPNVAHTLSLHFVEKRIGRDEIRTLEKPYLKKLMNEQDLAKVWKGVEKERSVYEQVLKDEEFAKRMQQEEILSSQRASAGGSRAPVPPRAEKTNGKSVLVPERAPLPASSKPNEKDVNDEKLVNDISRVLLARKQEEQRKATSSTVPNIAQSIPVNNTSNLNSSINGARKLSEQSRMDAEQMMLNAAIKASTASLPREEEEEEAWVVKEEKRVSNASVRQDKPQPQHVPPPLPPTNTKPSGKLLDPPLVPLSTPPTMPVMPMGMQPAQAFGKRVSVGSVSGAGNKAKNIIVGPTVVEDTVANVQPTTQLPPQNMPPPSFSSIRPQAPLPPQQAQPLMQPSMQTHMMQPSLQAQMMQPPLQSQMQMPLQGQVPMQHVSVNSSGISKNVMANEKPQQTGNWTMNVLSNPFGQQGPQSSSQVQGNTIPQHNFQASNMQQQSIPLQNSTQPLGMYPQQPGYTQPAMGRLAQPMVPVPSQNPASMHTPSSSGMGVNLSGNARPFMQPQQQGFPQQPQMMGMSQMGGMPAMNTGDKYSALRAQPGMPNGMNPNQMFMGPVPGMQYPQQSMQPGSGMMNQQQPVQQGPGMMNQQQYGMFPNQQQAQFAMNINPQQMAPNQYYQQNPGMFANQGQNPQFR